MRNLSTEDTGFTLIEMVMVILISGILAVGVTSFIGQSASGYVDRNERNSMASSMVVASEKLSRDIRRALPNSVRTGGDVPGNDNCIEFLPVLGGSRYVSVPLGVAAGSFNAVSLGNTAPLLAWIAVYPIDTNDLYSPSDATPVSITGVRATVPAGTNEITVSLGAPHRFRTNSPGRRFYAVDAPVAYCQPAGSPVLYRYTGYGFNQPAVLPPSGGSRDVLVTELSASAPVAFEYASATRTRNAVVSFELTAMADTETLKLGQEVQIRNVP